MSNNYKYIKVEIEDRICTIFLSRPKQRNAWNESMRNEIVDALDNASRDPEVRVVIVTGDPLGRAFCFGADLSSGDVGKSFHDSAVDDVPKGRKVDNGTWRDGGGIASLAVMRCTKPVIAAINGHAVGVGMTFPCACDMRVVSKNAKVGFVFARRGLACESLSSWSLPRLVGIGKANELVFTGRVFQANEAPPGLFNYVVEPEQVMSKARELAKEIAENTSAMSIVLSRHALIRNASMSPEEAHLVESRIIQFCSQNRDVKEGVTAFLEKREPKFTMDAHRDLPEFHPWWRQIETQSRL